MKLDLTTAAKNAPKPLEADEVRKLLRGSRLRQFLTNMYGNAVRFDGPNARLGDIATGERGGSVAVCLDGDKAGTFYDHNPGAQYSEGDVFTIWQLRYNCDFPAALEGINDWASGTPSREVTAKNAAQHKKAAKARQEKKEFQTKYEYTDEHNNILFVVRRFGLVYGDDGTPVLNSAGKQRKDFRVQSADGHKYPDDMELRPLYCLPSIVNDETNAEIYVCEGEKAADALRGIGLLATTMAGGSAAVTRADWSHLAGKDVIVWPDNDAAGLKCASLITEVLNGVANSVRVLPPYAAEEGADAADFLADGKDIAAFVNASPDLQDEWLDENIAALNIVNPSDVKMTARDWVSDGALIRGAITLFAAPPGTGKTAWSMQLAATYAMGSPFAGTIPVKPGKVLIINAEEPIDEMARRLRAACQGYEYDFDEVSENVKFISGYDNPLLITKQSGSTREIIVDAKTDAIAAYCRESDVSLVIMDPIAEFGHGEENDNNAQKQFFQALRKMAADGNFALLAFAHTPKTTSWASRANMNMVRGAGSVVGVARFVFTMLKLPVDEAEAYGIDKAEAWRYTALDLAKGNMIKGDHPGIWQKKESIDLVTADGEVESMPFMVDVQLEEPEKESAQVKWDRQVIAGQSFFIDTLFAHVGRVGGSNYFDVVAAIVSHAKQMGIKGLTQSAVKGMIAQIAPTQLGETYRLTDQNATLFVSCVDLTRNGKPKVEFYSDASYIPEPVRYTDMPWPF